MFGPLCWPPVAGVGKHMLGVVAGTCGHSLGHAPGCALRPCHAVLMCQHFLASTWAFACGSWHFGGFLPFLGSWHATTVSPWPVGLGAPKSMGHGLPVAPKWAHKAQPAVAWRGCQNANFFNLDCWDSYFSQIILGVQLVQMSKHHRVLATPDHGFSRRSTFKAAMPAKFSSHLG